MNPKIANIAQNTSYFTFALILQKIISFSYFAIIARALGPEDLGKYYFAISFTTIFAIFIDLGLTNVLTREVAKEKSKADEFLGGVLSLKIVFSFLTVLAAVVSANLFGYSELVKQLVYISAVSMVLDSFSGTFFAISRGFHNLFYESVGSVIFQLIVLSTGVLIIKTGGGLRPLIGALALASVFYFIFSLVLVRKKWKLSIRPKFDAKLAILILKITIPFSFFAIFQRIYSYLDSVLLSSLAGDYYVGIYQVAFKIVFALQFLPMAFVASLYPALSAYWARNREQLQVTFERAMNYLIIISLPIAAGIVVLADKFILIFKSGYAEALWPLRLNMFALPFIFLSFPVGALLNACDRQKANTVIMGIALAVSAAMNAVLIPRLQAVGASITVLATNALIFFLGLTVVPRITSYKKGGVAKIFFKSLFSVAVMAALALYLKPFLNIFAVTAISGAAYFSVLFLMKGFGKEDILSIYYSFFKKIQRNVID